jgi:ubiquinone/menaquinone biosynthesis C-methylase UbiE
MRLGLKHLAVQPGEHLLEIGPGTGMGLLDLSKWVGEFGRVYGLDLSPGMLQVAAKRLNKSGMAGRAMLAVGDGVNLPYSDSSFSALFMSFSLELFDTPEIPQVLAECRRVLKPGGRLGVVAMHKSAKSGFAERSYEWAHEKFTALIDCRPIDTEVLITAAGFILEQHQLRRMWGLPVDVIIAKQT